MMIHILVFLLNIYENCLFINKREEKRKSIKSINFCFMINTFHPTVI